MPPAEAATGWTPTRPKLTRFHSDVGTELTTTLVPLAMGRLIRSVCQRRRVRMGLGRIYISRGEFFCYFLMISTDTIRIVGAGTVSTSTHPTTRSAIPMSTLILPLTISSESR